MALQEQVDQWFTDNPNSTPQQLADAVKAAGGLDVNAGLADILGSRLGISTGEVTEAYNRLTAPAATSTPTGGALNQAAVAVSNDVGQANVAPTGALQQAAATTAIPMAQPVSQAAPISITAPSPIQLAVDKWVTDNPTGSPLQLATAIQAAGGLTPELANVLATKYGTTADEINAGYSRIIGEKTAAEKYQTDLTTFTDPMKSAIADIYKDNSISWDEANEVRKFANQTGFKAEDIARVTGVPIEKVNELLGMSNQMLGSAIESGQFQDPLALVTFMQQNNLSSKDLAAASGGKYTADQIDAYAKPFADFQDAINSGAGGLTEATAYSKLADAINADPALKEKYGSLAQGIGQVQDIIDRAVNKDHGGKEANWMYEMFTGLNKAAQAQAKDETGLVEERDPETGELTGYSKEISSPSYDSNSHLTAHYDANKNLTGYDSRNRIYVSDPQWYGARWDAQGNAVPVSGYTKGGGWVKNTLQDMGPLPQIALAIATDGMSLEMQVASQAALQVASGVPLDKAVTNAAAMYAGSQVVNIPAIKETVGALDNAALQNIAKGAISGATSAGILGKDIQTGALTGGTGAAIGNVVSNIAADQGLNKSQTNTLNAAASVFTRSMLAGATLEQAFQAAAMAGGMANAKSVVKGLKDEKISGIDIPDEFANQVESGGIKLASADGSLPIEIGGVPIYAESKNASSVEAPVGYRLLSMDESDSKPEGSYYDITQNAWMAPDEAQMGEISDLQKQLAGSGTPSGYGGVVTEGGQPSDGGIPEIVVTDTRDTDIPEIVITDTRDTEIPEIVITDTREEPLSPVIPTDVGSPGPVTPVEVKPPTVTTPPATTTPSTPVTKTPTTGGGAPAATTASALTGYIPPALKESLIKTKITGGKFQDPTKHLKDIQEAQVATEKNMIQNGIDPQLAAILSARAVQSVDQPQIPHFTYGQEDSIDDILGKADAGALDQAYAEGGYVQPLTLAPGGLAAPLMAASGGLPSKTQGREDFRQSKHVAGEGDGHSDDIPAMLADGEFVFSADVVSALGNGSTKAGSDKLYKMVEEIRKRARSTSPDKLAPPALKSPLDYLKKR